MNLTRHARRAPLWLLFAVVLLTTVALVASDGAHATPPPGGTLDPTTIQKWARPLVIPPEMPATAPNYYEIAVQQFEQQILPVPLPKTTVWSYGSANHSGTLNYPAFTIEAKAGTPTRVKWINGLVDSNGDYLPHLLAVDQTLDWANPPGGLTGRDTEGTDQTRYMGPVPIVTHVHGAHTGPESDGFPEAWWLPDASNIPAGYATRGTAWDQIAGVADEAGAATFEYRNDQPAATLWYHDHSLGMTRLNVYAGPAGFYLLRGGESDLPAGALPGPSPKVGDPSGMKYYEIPIAIQDRSFNADGSLFYPDHRAFFEGLLPDNLNFPFKPSPGLGGPSDVPKTWNPEFFGNTMVVNGTTWPYLEVEQRRYRFRLLNGCDSRFLILKTDAGVPMWQIGTDLGFMPEPLEQSEMLLGPAERADVIFDFSGFEPGETITLLNLGPDEPFGGGEPGIDFEASDPATTGQVMQFRVVAIDGTDASADPATLDLPDVPMPATSTNTRQVSLNELESETVLVSEEDDEQSGGSQLVLDPEGEPFGPTAALLGTVNPDGTGNPLRWMDPVTEKPVLDTTETWEIHNFTMDAHPIHLHLVHLEVVERTDMMGNPRPLEPWEVGSPKDTVIAYPGEITRVKAVFDIAGRYVWHCHIIEHEDNEMMRPYEVSPMLVDKVFPDVPATHPFHEAITYLAARGVIDGYASGQFGPESFVKRAQVAKMVILALGEHNVATTNLGKQSFPDVDFTGQPYPFDYVEEASEQGIVHGYVGGMFDPWRDVTRIQLTRMVVAAAGDGLAAPPAGYQSGFTDIDPNDEALVAKAKFNGLIQGKNETAFDPYSPATRGHVAQVIYRAVLKSSEEMPH